ncbi:MAG: phage minor head protein [Pseudomonadota bacterium]
MATKAEYGNLPFQEAIKFFRSKVKIPTESWQDLMTFEHDTGFMIAGATKAELLADFQVAVDQAIAEGTTLETFRKSFDQIVAKHGWNYKGSRGWRSEVIYSTNVRSAYQAGRYQQMTDPDVLAYRPYWMYVHGDAKRPRPLHLSWHGLVLPWDDPWWQTHRPLNGWGCHCSVQALSERDMTRKKVSVGTAPDNGTYEWTNKRTGEVSEIPNGIDPGFDYGPGASPEADRRRIIGQSIAGLPPELQDKVRAEVKEKTGVEL